MACNGPRQGSECFDQVVPANTATIISSLILSALQCSRYEFLLQYKNKTITERKECYNYNKY